MTFHHPIRHGLGILALAGLISGGFYLFSGGGARHTSQSQGRQVAQTSYNQNPLEATLAWEGEINGKALRFYDSKRDDQLHTIVATEKEGRFGGLYTTKKTETTYTFDPENGALFSIQEWVRGRRGPISYVESDIRDAQSNPISRTQIQEAHKTFIHYRDTIAQQIREEGKKDRGETPQATQNSSPQSQRPRRSWYGQQGSQRSWYGPRADSPLQEAFQKPRDMRRPFDIGTNY